MKLKNAIAFLAIGLFGAVYSQDNSTSFGKGMINFVAKDSSFSIKFAPRFQVRYNSNWNYDGNSYSSPEYNFLVRRARLKFNGFAYSPKLRYKIELGLSNRDLSGANQFNRNTPRYILDAFIIWEFAKNFELWAGQTKLPGNIDRVVSSGNLQLIDRSLLNSKFTLDRDMGIQLHYKSSLGEHFFIRKKLAISQGEGRNVTEGNEGGLQYTARLELLPFGEFKSKGDYVQSDLVREKRPKLMLASTYNYNHKAVKTRSTMGDYMFKNDGSLYETDITTVIVDAMFKYNGLSFMAEYANRSAQNPTALNTDGTTTGDLVLVGHALNLQTGYLLKSNYEFVGRFTTLKYESVTNTLPTQQFTLGANKFIVGHKLKVQGDLSYTTLDGKQDNIMLRLGFDIHL